MRRRKEKTPQSLLHQDATLFSSLCLSLFPNASVTPTDKPTNQQKKST
jgi:hypothetical protein